MKRNKTRCIWVAFIASTAVCTALTTVNGQGNLGIGYISSVTGVDGECVRNTTDGNTHKWDIQAGGTYRIVLSNVIDACSQGYLSSMEVVVHNSTGGNIVTTANQVNGDQGEYEFTITLGGQCETMPIEYCMTGGHNTQESMFAQGFNGTRGDGFTGHLRVATFDDGCNVTGNPSCQAQATPTPTPCTASITACKYYDFNANGKQDVGELALAGWPLCLSAGDGRSFTPVQQSAGAGGCFVFSNLGPGTYIVTEGNASGYFGSTNSSTITIDHCDQNVTVSFGNYCLVNSGGLTMGFWSNKNGNKLITGNANGTGTTLLPSVVTLLNACQLRNADGTLHTFTNSYSAFKTWLLGATATNMACMLSAQLAALELDIYFNKVDGNAFDLCASSTVSYLIASACDQLHDNPITLSGNAARADQEHLKNCIDAINNNGPVVPVTPCDHAGASVQCGQ